MHAEFTCMPLAGEAVTLTAADCLRFTLLRERYVPYAILQATFLLRTEMPLPVRLQMRLDGRLLHDGMVTKAACTREGGLVRLTVTARSYTAVLTKNQLVPGLHYHVTLGSLLETYALPHVTYDSGMAEVGYIYVKESATMWDSLMAYNYKLNGSIPYIRAANHVCVLPQAGTEEIVLPEERLTARTEGSRCGEMISRIDMADAAGEYGSFTGRNPEAEAREIVQVRQMLLDRQYLYDPEQAIRFRLQCSNRRRSSWGVRYLGYCGEDIEDLVRVGQRAGHVSRILLCGESGVLTTEDSFYADDFCNRSSM